MPLEQFLKPNKLYFFDLKKIKIDIESFWLLMKSKNKVFVTNSLKALT